MNLHPQPIFQVTLNGKDLSKTLNDRLMELSITDARDGEADQLEITLSDADGKLDLPPRGAKLAVSLGWMATGLTAMGVFSVDELEHSGAPDTLRITARSADFRASLADKREHSWHDTTIGNIVKTIAARQKLKPVISAALARIAIKHIDQTSESDLSFLQRLAGQHGTFATVKEEKLIFMKAGGAQTASGQPLPKLSITRALGDHHRFSISDREQCSVVIARYQDTKGAKTGEVRYNGQLEKKGKKPVKNAIPANTGNAKTLRHCYASKANAERAVKGAWAKAQRGMATFSITLALGRPEIKPEYPVEVQGFKPVIDNEEWLIKRVVHRLGGGGYISEIELEMRTADFDKD